MPIVQLVVLAIVQGLTEFIPVSSSAHLILAPHVLNWDDQGRAIDVAAHVGSLLAVLLYFRRETGQLTRGAFDTVLFRQTDDRHLFLVIATATIPLVIFGLGLAATGVADAMRDPQVIAAASIFFGIILWVADRRPTTKDTLPTGWSAALTIGVAQALATIPGTSRSGITITAARWLGFDRENAATFSMLLAIPAISMAGLYEFLRLLQEGGGAPWSAILIVTGLSFLAAWAAIAIFLRMTRSLDFTVFVIYRIVLGVLLFIIFS